MKWMPGFSAVKVSWVEMLRYKPVNIYPLAVRVTILSGLDIDVYIIFPPGELAPALINDTHNAAMQLVPCILGKIKGNC